MGKLRHETYACAMPIKGAVSAPKRVSAGPIKNSKTFAPKPGTGLKAIKGAVTKPNAYV